MNEFSNSILVTNFEMLTHHSDDSKVVHSVFSTQALVIRTASFATKKDILAMAEAIETTVVDFIGCMIVKQSAEDKRNMSMTICHRMYSEKMNTKTALDRFRDEKFTEGPMMASNEFRIKEGEKIEVSSDKNICFSSQDETRILTFHSNFNSASMQTTLLHKDEYAQKAHDEYHGNIICRRTGLVSTDELDVKVEKTGDELCKLPVTIPKKVGAKNYSTPNLYLSVMH